MHTRSWAQCREQWALNKCELVLLLTVALHSAYLLSLPGTGDAHKTLCDSEEKPLHRSQALLFHHVSSAPPWPRFPGEDWGREAERQCVELGLGEVSVRASERKGGTHSVWAPQPELSFTFSLCLQTHIAELYPSLHSIMKVTLAVERVSTDLGLNPRLSLIVIELGK